MTKQDWIVTLRFTETEGDPKTTTKPWYEEHDIASLVHSHLLRQGNIRDLTLTHVQAHTDGPRYLNGIYQDMKGIADADR